MALVVMHAVVSVDVPATLAVRPWRWGLVDEVAMDVVPVVFGSGKRCVRH